MPRNIAPLAELTDGEVLQLVARALERRAQALSDFLQAGDVLAIGEADAERHFNRQAAARLRQLARRVPLWTDRK